MQIADRTTVAGIVLGVAVALGTVAMPQDFWTAHEGLRGPVLISCAIIVALCIGYLCYLHIDWRKIGYPIIHILLEDWWPRVRSVLAMVRGISPLIQPLYVGHMSVNINTLVNDHYILISATCFNPNDTEFLVTAISGSTSFTYRPGERDVDIPLMSPQFREGADKRRAPARSEFRILLIQLIPGEYVAVVNDAFRTENGVVFNLENVAIEMVNNNQRTIGRLWDKILVKFSDEYPHVSRLLSIRFGTIYNSAVPTDQKN